MKRISALSMLLLFMIITTNAKAEDLYSPLATTEKKQRKTEKVLALLRTAGLTHPMFAETAEYVRENSYDDYFYITQKHYDNDGKGLNLGLRHEIGTPKLERFELFLKEDGSNYIYTLSSEAVMVRYQMDISW